MLVIWVTGCVYGYIFYVARRGSSLSALRDLCVFGLLPKGVGEQHVLKPWCSSLLFSFVSQSHVLSKIGGECGQGNPNIIAIHQVYSQGDDDPSSKASGRLHLAITGSEGAHKPIGPPGPAGPWRPTHQLHAVSLVRWELGDFAGCLNTKQAHTHSWASQMNCTEHVVC